AASDRIQNIVSDMNTLAAKLQDRINQAKANGRDVTSWQKALDDAKSKLTDAQTQAQNAVNTVTPLQPDNGDNSVLQSNMAVLKKGRDYVHAGNQDLKNARLDFQTVRNAFGKTEKASGTVTPTVTTIPSPTHL